MGTAVDAPREYKPLEYSRWQYLRVGKSVLWHLRCASTGVFPHERLSRGGRGVGARFCGLSVVRPSAVGGEGGGAGRWLVQAAPRMLPSTVPPEMETPHVAFAGYVLSVGVCRSVRQHEERLDVTFPRQ